jgi:hypothetical protein
VNGNSVHVGFEPNSRQRAAARATVARRYPAHVARQIALAHALQRRVDSGEFADYAAMARNLGFTRARISQLMDLLLLAPDIQEELLSLEVPPGRQPLSERRLRESVLKTLDWGEQRRAWQALRAQLATR